MKRNLWFKILSLFAVLCMCFSLVACSMNINEYDEETNEDVFDVTLTEEELIDFHQNGAKYPENFVFKKISGYGRVIESTSSREEALTTAAEHFTCGDYVTVENRLTVETNLYYGLYVKWAYQSNGTVDMSRYYDEYVVSFKKSVYDAENMQFFTKDKKQIKQIINYIYYSRSYEIGGTKVYSSGITLDNNQYTYTAYLLLVTYGDWGVQDELRFVKLEHNIDLSTGLTETNFEVIETVLYCGKSTHGGKLIEE